MRVCGCVCVCGCVRVGMYIYLSMWRGDIDQQPLAVGYRMQLKEIITS